jgi:hypothetical protein
MTQGMNFKRNLTRNPVSGVRAFSEPTTQAELFPLRTLIESPGVICTADAWGKVVAADTHHYIVKGDKGGPNVRASEWIGTHIAEAIHIPCPTAKIIQMSDGQPMFGSREIAGISDQTVTAAILTSSPLLAGWSR